MNKFKCSSKGTKLRNFCTPQGRFRLKTNLVSTKRKKEKLCQKTHLSTEKISKCMQGSDVSGSVIRSP